MKITNARVIVGSQDRNVATLLIETDDDLVGLGIDWRRGEVQRRARATHTLS